MKATGIVRRIDDLGRVVVPKEIRRTLRIREGDPLEIFTDKEGGIILKKYSHIGELGDFVQQYAEAMAINLEQTVCITDRDKVIAAAGSQKKEFIDKFISKELENLMNNRENIVVSKGDRSFVKIIQEEIEEEVTSEVIQSIICEGDVIGSIVIISKSNDKKLGELEKKLALVGANFLGKQMES